MKTPTAHTSLRSDWSDMIVVTKLTIDTPVSRFSYPGSLSSRSPSLFWREVPAVKTQYSLRKRANCRDSLKPVQRTFGIFRLTGRHRSRFPPILNPNSTQITPQQAISTPPPRFPRRTSEPQTRVAAFASPKESRYPSPAPLRNAPFP